MVKIVENASLAELCTLGVGGPAAYLATAETEADVDHIVRWAKRRGLPLCVLGGGSNVVVSDEGVDGVVLQVALRGTQWEAHEGQLRANAGEPWDDLVKEAVRRGWAGIECLSGIPGWVGATPVQNVGAYGQEVADTIQLVTVYDRERLCVTSLSRTECHFAYRDSVFKSSSPGRYIVLQVEFQLRPGSIPRPTYAPLVERLALHEQPTVELVRSEVLKLRRAKSMVLESNATGSGTCGSFFLNPIVDAACLRAVREAVGQVEIPAWPQPSGSIKLPAAWLIEQSGFCKGTRKGNVGLSDHHALAIVCSPGARASEVMSFALLVREAVLARFGIGLELEPALWGWRPRTPSAAD